MNAIVHNRSQFLKKTHIQKFIQKRVLVNSKAVHLLNNVGTEGCFDHKLLASYSTYVHTYVRMYIYIKVT